MKYCIYRTYHSDGRWYIGRGITEKVKSGKYQGSGVRIKRALKKYPNEFVTEVLHEGLTSEQADALEAQLVTQHIIDTDPLCLNLVPGGKHSGWAHDELRAVEIGQRISLTRKQRFANDPEFAAKYVTYAKKANDAMTQKTKATPYVIVHADKDISFNSLAEMRTYIKAEKLVVSNVGTKRYLVTGDRYYECEGHKFKTMAELQALAKEKRAKLIKLDTRHYALLSRILNVCGECGFAHRGVKNMTKHVRAEHGWKTWERKTVKHLGCKETTWLKGR